MENTERRGQRGDKEKAKEEGEGRRRRREKEERGGRDREGEKEEKHRKESRFHGDNRLGFMSCLRSCRSPRFWTKHSIHLKLIDGSHNSEIIYIYIYYIYIIYIFIS